MEYYINDALIGLCPPNHNSSNGLVPCQPCHKGTYQDEYGQSFCNPCLSEADDIACSKGITMLN